MNKVNLYQIFASMNRRFIWRLGRRLYLMARNDFNGSLEANGESWLQREVLNILRKRSINAVVFDVGANIGSWTLLLIKNAQTIHTSATLNLHAFEPFPSTFSTLAGRLQNYQSGISIQCHELALSSEDGETYMFGKANLGTSSMHSGIKNLQLEKVKITRKKVDTYCTENSIEEIHLLKCDAEGHDFEVIRGATSLLKNGKIWFFQFEYNHRWIYSRHYLKDVFEFIRGTRYKLSRLTSKGLEIYNHWDPELERFFECNYVLIRDDLVNHINNWNVTLDSTNTFA